MQDDLANNRNPQLDQPHEAGLQGESRPGPVTAYLAPLTPRSRRTMQGFLRLAATLLWRDQGDPDKGGLDALPWHELGSEKVDHLRDALAARYAPSTVNTLLGGVRGVLKESLRLGRLSSEGYLQATEVPLLRREFTEPGPPLTADELKGLIGVCEADLEPSGLRDAALFAVLFGTGLKRSEVVLLDFKDYDPERQEVQLGRRLWYDVDEQTQFILEYWKRARTPTPGPWFCPVNRGNNVVVHHRLTDQSIYDIIRTRAKEANLRKISPNDFSRTYQVITQARQLPGPPRRRSDEGEFEFVPLPFELPRRWFTRR